MGWEWGLMIAFTFLGPLIFRGCMLVRQEVTLRGGATVVVNYGPLVQVLRTAGKFAVYWFVALALTGLGDRLWLRLWVLCPPIILLPLHFALARKHGIDAWTGKARTT